MYCSRKHWLVFRKLMVGKYHLLICDYILESLLQ